MAKKKKRGEFSQVIDIDGNRMYEVFKERDLHPTQIAKEIGVNQGYFSNAKYTNRMSLLVVSLLESKYDIPRELYLPVEEEKVEETTAQIIEVVQQPDIFSEENQKKLYKLMYSAVYNAMKCALSE